MRVSREHSLLNSLHFSYLKILLFLNFHDSENPIFLFLPSKRERNSRMSIRAISLGKNSCVSRNEVLYERIVSRARRPQSQFERRSEEIDEL